MNTELLGLWMSVTLIPLGILLLIIWLVTGKTKTPLRVAGGASLLLGFAGFAMANYL